MGLKITTQPDPVRGFLSPNPMQPDTPTWIVCLNPTPRTPALFTSYTCYPTQVWICPSLWSRQPAYSSSHVNIDDSRQTIYITTRKKCVKRKPSPGPTRLICVFFRAEPSPNLRVWSGFNRPTRPVENSTCVLYCCSNVMCVENSTEYVLSITLQKWLMSLSLMGWKHSDQLTQSISI